MAAEDISISSLDAKHLLVWLDEQRQIDHERLAQLSLLVEQLRREVRDQGTAQSHAESMSATRGSTEVRSNDGLAVDLGDHIGRLGRALEEHVATQTRATQAESAMRDRERRQLADVTQLVETHGRTLGLSAGRVSALSEEIRHERDSRAPIAQALDELQRTQTTITNRIGAIDQVVRRLSGAVGVVEAGDERQRTDLGRVENLIKLIDLRVTRDLADIQRVMDEWKTRIEEQIKPVDGLSRIVEKLVDQREALRDHSLSVDETIERIVKDVGNLEVQSKADRTAMQRNVESVDALARRLEGTGAAIWQIGERVNALVDDINVARGDIRTVVGQIEVIEGRAQSADDAHRQLEVTHVALAQDVRTLRTDARRWADALENRLDTDMTVLTETAQFRYRASVDNLRRTVAELQQQLRELEAGLT